MKFSVIGLGYVGLSLATLIAQKFSVYGVDTDSKKIDLINKKVSPINDKDIEFYLKNKNLDITVTNKISNVPDDIDIFIICAPTNYDDKTGWFDTSQVESIISQIIKLNNKAIIAIKSTIPLGFTDIMKNKYDNENIIFSPEFLRESKALSDNLYPSRIIVGGKNDIALKFAHILADCCLLKKEEIKIMTMDSSEAEAIKLFSNTYLAMRISFFNELDSFCLVNGLNTKDVIVGIGLDDRIGLHYNNPSFGYGGYCLPKDTKQLLKNFGGVPNNIISSIVESNITRKKFIADEILKSNKKTIGIYRLIMKEGSDNIRDSAVFDIIQILCNHDLDVIVYEPLIINSPIDNVKIIKDFEAFSQISDIIIANRISEEIYPFIDKVFSRDVFEIN